MFWTHDGFHVWAIFFIFYLWFHAARMTSHVRISIYTGCSITSICTFSFRIPFTSSQFYVMLKTFTCIFSGHVKASQAKRPLMKTLVTRWCGGKQKWELSCCSKLHTIRAALSALLKSFKWRCNHDLRAINVICYMSSDTFYSVSKQLQKSLRRI